MKIWKGQYGEEIRTKNNVHLDFAELQCIVFDRKEHYESLTNLNDKIEFIARILKLSDKEIGEIYHGI